MTEGLFKIVVSRFGPIEEGEIEFKPLTIFFGKNNTGKTYMGYLLWGLSSQRGFYHYLEPRIETYEETLQEFKEFMKKLRKKKTPSYYPKFYEGLPVDNFLGEYTLNGLRAEIKESFIKNVFNHPIEFEKGEIIIPKKI